MTKLTKVKAEVTILVTLHHWKASRNLCNTRVQDFFGSSGGEQLSVQKMSRKETQSHWNKQAQETVKCKQPTIAHGKLSHQLQVPGYLGANSTTGWGGRRILFLVPSQLLPAIMSFSHILIPAHSNRLNLTDRVKTQFSIPAQESVTFQPLG